MRNLLVIPSIDIKGGKTVRVVQGIPELYCEQYGDDPVDMARIWRTENAKLIHIVDFDGAYDHSKRNFKVVEEICSSVLIPVEFAGGIRNYEDTIEIMKTGMKQQPSLIAEYDGTWFRQKELMRQMAFVLLISVLLL